MFRRFHRGWAVVATAVVGWLASPANVLAQCAMCGTALQDKADPLAQSIRSSILFMASMPFVLFLTVAGWLVYRFRRPHGEDDDLKENTH
ncbi:MAG: hypothetical protein ACE5HU_00770 [Acidobacteriota bacterium]